MLALDDERLKPSAWLRTRSPRTLLAAALSPAHTYGARTLRISHCWCSKRDTTKHHVQPAMGRQALEPGDEEAQISPSARGHGSN